MLNNINKPIIEAFAVIQNACAVGTDISTLEKECAFMVAGGKERVYTRQLATRLSGAIIAKLTDNIVQEEIITVYPTAEGEKQPLEQTQSFNASLYTVGAYSLLMSGFTNADIIESAIVNWIDEDSVRIEQEIDCSLIAANMMKQFIKDGILESDQDDAQWESKTYRAHGCTPEIIALRQETMFSMWDKSKPKMKPMLHKLTWSISGKCELKNFTFKEEVTQHFVDALNIAGHTGYKINPQIRAGIKRNLLKGKYVKKEIIREMTAVLKLDPTQTYFLPHKPDHRGRVYPMGGLTTHAGTKDTRAAFDFATSKKVVEDGLFLHIANACGYDKDSITNRIQWVRNSHLDLMSTPRKTLYAERARLAYIEYKTTGMANIVCRIDGTVSGVQITSGLFLNSKTAKAVNVSASSPDDMPQDLYGIIADLAIKLSNKGTDKAMLKKYHRDITKDLIMVLAYGAGDDTLTRTLKEFLTKNNERTSTAPSLKKVIMQAIAQEYSAITRLNDNLKLLLECDPLNKLVYQLSDIKVKLNPTNTKHLNIHGTSYTAKLQGKALPDPEALQRGSAPNIVHSLDAELLRKAIVIVNDDVSPIHDDLGVHSCDVRKALQAVRTAYVEVIKAEPLKQVYIGMGIEEEYEPADGDLDINEALESSYIFS